MTSRDLHTVARSWDLQRVVTTTGRTVIRYAPLRSLVNELGHYRFDEPSAAAAGTSAEIGSVAAIAASTAFFRSS